MTPLIDDNPIRRAFSNAAMQYDMLTTLQKDIGRELLRKLGEEDCSAILDVGMGTGYLTKKLLLYFPEAVVVGLDFAPGMIDVAGKQDEPLNIIQADARQLPFKNEVFDIIVSNLAYQWVGELSGAFAGCYQSLKREGTMVFTMFGYNTLKELFTALEKCRGTAGCASAGDLPIRIR
jgi:malonyl-CoA O-methyltransferase